MLIRELLDRMKTDPSGLAAELIRLRHEKGEEIAELTVQVGNLSKIIRVLSDREARDRRTAQDLAAVEDALLRSQHDENAELDLDALYILNIGVTDSDLYPA